MPSKTLAQRSKILFFPSSATFALHYLRFFFGKPFRFVLAKSLSCFWLIDLYMLLDAPLREALLRFPRLAASAAPAAICCFLDFAGIT